MFQLATGYLTLTGAMSSFSFLKQQEEMLAEKS